MDGIENALLINMQNHNIRVKFCTKCKIKVNSIVSQLLKSPWLLQQNPWNSEANFIICSFDEFLVHIRHSSEAGKKINLRQSYVQKRSVQVCSYLYTGIICSNFAAINLIIKLYFCERIQISIFC